MQIPTNNKEIFKFGLHYQFEEITSRAEETLIQINKMYRSCLGPRSTSILRNSIAFYTSSF